MLIPNLIFGENHFDSANGRILSKLIPKLKSLGYHRFLDELPPVTTLEEQMQFFEGMYNQIRQIVLDFVHVNSAETEKRILSAENQEAEGEMIFQVLSDFLSNSNQRSDILLSLKCFHPFILNPVLLYQALYICGIKFQPIDDPIIKTFLPEPKAISITTFLESNSLTKPIIETMDIRNKTMSKAYLSAQEPVFGVVGLAHIEGIQNEIIKSLGQISAAEKYSFFYIYSGSQYRDRNIWLNQNSIHELPIDVTIIDATQKSDDEIIKMIINLVMSKLDPYKPESIATYAATTFFGSRNNAAELSQKDLENNSNNKRSRYVLL
jgi:hypothetical protein